MSHHPPVGGILRQGVVLLGQEGVNRSVKALREPALWLGHTLGWTCAEIWGRRPFQQAGGLLVEQLGVREGEAEQQRGERHHTQHNDLDSETPLSKHGRDSMDTQYFSKKIK